MATDFLESAKKQFAYYKLLGEKAMSQLDDEKLHWQYNNDCNSVSTIIQHLGGNMLSRWTNFLNSDGEKVWRNRDAEFENMKLTTDEMMTAWNDGWKCLLDALDSLTPGDLQKEIFIRNMGQTVTEAINRQLCHYSYHIGQIVFIAKMVCNDNWQSLSIPKGQSTQYNADKFAQGKHTAHFTDEIFPGSEKQAP